MHCGYRNFTVGCSVAPISVCEWLTAELVLLNRRNLKCNSASHIISVLLEIFSGITGQNIILNGQLNFLDICVAHVLMLKRFQSRFSAACVCAHTMLKSSSSLS